MARLFIFGMGYSAQVLARHARAAGWAVEGTGRAGRIDFADEGALRAALARASHVLSSVPPADGVDPVLARYGAALAERSGEGGWLGYLSATGVYGDTGGAWVDESASVVGAGVAGRRMARASADAQWLALGARVFRLPGIYGPGRSALDRVRAGTAQRIDLPGQVFSRVHVDDIAGGILSAIAAGVPGAAYNLADDTPASQNEVIAEACRLLGLPLPPLVSLGEAGLSAAARGFYGENRRVANGRLKRLAGWRPAYPSFREGLAALRPEMAISSPASASPDPNTASALQR